MYITTESYEFPEGREGDDECQVRHAVRDSQQSALRDVRVTESALKLEMGGGPDKVEIEISAAEFHRVLAALVDAGAATLDTFGLGE